MTSLTELLQLHTKSAFPRKNQQEMPKSHLTNNVIQCEQVKFTSEYKILTVNDLTITVCIDNYFLCNKTEAFPFKYSLSKTLVYQQVGAPVPLVACMPQFGNHWLKMTHKHCCVLFCSTKLQLISRLSQWHDEPSLTTNCTHILKKVTKDCISKIKK